MHNLLKVFGRPPGVQRAELFPQDLHFHTTQAVYHTTCLDELASSVTHTTHDIQMLCIVFLDIISPQPRGAPHVSYHTAWGCISTAAGSGLKLPFN